MLFHVHWFLKDFSFVLIFNYIDFWCSQFQAKNNRHACSEAALLPKHIIVAKHNNLQNENMWSNAIFQSLSSLSPCKRNL